MIGKQGPLQITASKLYDYLQCEHKVWRDEHGPRHEKIEETNPFVELLWKKGTQHEKFVVKNLEEYKDLSAGSIEERIEWTLQAINDHVPIIYQGVLREDNLFGIPDLLIFENGQYYPVDIKSGSGTTTSSSSEQEELHLKKHYAVQLAVYIDLLQRKKLISHRIGYVIDIDSEKIKYDLNEAIGKKSNQNYWDIYLEIKEIVLQLMADKIANLPALSSVCKLCPWYNSCTKWAQESDDLTQLYDAGRSARDTIKRDLDLSTIHELSNISIPELLVRKKKEKGFLHKIGGKTLKSLKLRAHLFHYNLPPVIHEYFTFPEVTYELFFDIEDDPTQNFVYLHGVYQRTKENTLFRHFTAHEISPEQEQKAWADFWQYIDTLPEDDFAVYYYSHHEKTTYLKLQQKYPDVISIEKVKAFFDHPHVIDLFKIINSATDWPIGSYSLKDIATYLGFAWRDDTPSGALSIKWFNDYIEQQDEQMLQRILEYNEDDCKATMVIKDELVRLVSEVYP